MNRIIPTIILSFILYCHSSSQNTDSLVITRFFGAALSDTTSYHNLRQLCTNIGGRIAGSPQAAKAVLWTKQVLDGMGLDKVFLQEINVRHWIRGQDEMVFVNPDNPDGFRLHACAIGGSVGTNGHDIKAKVIEVSDFDQMNKLGKEKIEGKIVFFNHPADPTFYYTFNAYGGTARYRVNGATQAAYYGAVAVVVRSATTAHDDFPHTGILHYADTVMQIPAMCISTNDADALSRLLKIKPESELLVRASNSEKPEVVSYNVIGEIKGSEHPEEIIVFGGHLDSWDNGQGANDDGTGVVQTIEILRLFKALNIKPKRTIRVVAFMDEEMEQRGAKKYADFAKSNSEQRKTNSEKHIAAIEADRGGSTPYGFSIDAPDDKFQVIQSWKSLLLPYGIWSFEKGGSGVDIRDLKSDGASLIALITDSQRYFDYHHSPNDTFDHVNQRELQLGSAAMAALVYLIDKYGL